VGECFFWYRLTRVFPDKFHRAVKRLCVCVLYVLPTAFAGQLLKNQWSIDWCSAQWISEIKSYLCFINWS